MQKGEDYPPEEAYSFKASSSEGSETEVLSGYEASQVISEIYEQLDPETACHLVDANIVLAVAGLKGVADIPWAYLDKEKGEMLERVNGQIGRLGYKIIFNKNILDYETQESSTGELQEEPTFGSLYLLNTKGIENKSKATRIPGVKRFDSRLGVEECERWIEQLKPVLQTAQREGEIAVGIDLDLLKHGILLGYPDQAIRDYVDRVSKGKSEAIELEESDIASAIPDSEEYKGAVPEFDYYAEHADDTEIIDYVRDCRRVLMEFYDSPWFKQIENDPSLIKAREELSLAIEQAIAEREEEVGNVT